MRTRSSLICAGCGDDRLALKLSVPSNELDELSSCIHRIRRRDELKGENDVGGVNRLVRVVTGKDRIDQEAAAVRLDEPLNSGIAVRVLCSSDPLYRDPMAFFTDCAVA